MLDRAQLELATAADGERVQIGDGAAAAVYVQSIFDREMGVTLHNAKAGSRRDEAMSALTREAANLYARRVLRELIQNAFDGARTAAKPRILLRLDLSEKPHGAVYVANNGQGFTRDNVDAISNPAMSNKTPGNFIGHKGLGFRSVELLSDDVQIFSKIDPAAATFDGFCFSFASHDDERAWLESAGEHDFVDLVVGRAHRLQLPVPIAPSDAKADPIAAAGFSTLVRLPLRDHVAAARAAEEMRLLLDEKAPITLFLDRLDSLMLETIDAEGRREPKELRRSGKGTQKSAFGRSLVIEEVTVDRQRYLIGQMEVDEVAFRASVDQAVDENYPVEMWREWGGAPTVSIALPLSQDARPGNFYAFLPMDTPAPFNGCLDAPFHPAANRRDLDLDNPLNAFLLDSIADLCLAVSRTIAASDATSPAISAAAVDALAWPTDAQRIVDACERAELPLDDIRLPAIRSRDGQPRWAALSVIYDWADDDYRMIDAAWLTRACEAPMLRRGLGRKRVAALTDFILKVDYTLAADESLWAEWAPMLAADLARPRRKTTKKDWEDFYADLASLPAALPHLRGKAIFRLEDGSLGDANAPETLAERELFISANPENAARQRKRVAGTTLFPPKSVARRMLFADPSLSWPAPVTSAFVASGLATEFSLPRVIAGMGRLLGKRPGRQTALAAVGWAFAAWKSHKSNEVEKALRAAQLPIPSRDAKLRIANTARFGAGWRDTQGDLLAEFCDAVGSESRHAQSLSDSLLTPWDEWPLRERGSAREWSEFLRLLGVRDGLTPVYHKAVSQHVGDWRSLRLGLAPELAVEALIGETWRQAVAGVQGGFGYQSGHYSTNETLYAFQLQGEHVGMNDRAKRAYAGLVLRALPDLEARFLTTTLTRTAGMGDTVAWPSPLLAFLREAPWLPVTFADQTSWKRPLECWFAPRTDSLPPFLSRLERPVRDAIDGSQPLRDLFSGRLGLRMWHSRASAPDRLVELGDVLQRGIAEHEHHSFRTEYRGAWNDWNEIEPRPALPAGMPLAVQAGGRLACHVADPEDPQTIFVSGGADPTLDNLLMALGHRLLSVPPSAARNVANTLSQRTTDTVRLVEEVEPRIIVDGEELDLAAERPRLTEDGRDWLAEIAVLVLEFHNSAITRSTARSRQNLFEAFRRLRVVHSRTIEVEIDDRAGPLPAVLDGVLSVPHAERPTVVVEGSAASLDWQVLARIAGGVALALDRAWLLTDFRAAFYAIALSQPTGLLTRPDDETIARAFRQPVERVREIQRSLRAGNRRIMDWLVPAVAARIGIDAANRLLDRESSLIEDDEIVGAIAADGSSPDQARMLVEACREAEGLDELRRTLGISLGSFNAACAMLGPRFPQLSFERTLRRTFEDRVDELRPSLAQRVRDAYAAARLEDVELAIYASARGLDWIVFDESWIASHDELVDVEIDARIDALAASALPSSGGNADGSLDELRQSNRAVLASMIEHLRRVVSAWASKLPERTLPAIWSSRSELIVREALASGAFDFFELPDKAMPQALLLAGLWPAGMPATIDLTKLELDPEDLKQQEKAEQRRREEDERKSKTVRFGEVEIVGGTSNSLQQVVEALQAGLASKAFQSRSGPAILRPFPEGDERQPRKRGKGTTDKDPTYLTDIQRNLIGFAGEYAAYVHLKRRVRNFADEHWISSLGRSYLCLPAMQDRGYDFHVPRSRGGLYFEVKAHTGDPGYIDLERSQVEAAVQFADERHGIWKILYVSHVLNGDLLTVHELENPFSEGNMRLFRPSSRQGVRLLIDRE